MRLPGRTEGAVQQLTSVDPGVYTARGEAFGEMAKTIVTLADDWEQKKATAANVDAILSMSNKETELKEGYGSQRSFTAAELKAMGEKVTDEMMTHSWIDGAGKRQSELRDDVPAEEVYPKYKKRILEEEAKRLAEGLNGKVRKQEFMARQQEIINNAYVADMKKAQITREAKQLSHYERQISEAERAGSFDLAIGLVDDHPTMDTSEKAIERTRLRQEEEKRHLFNLRNNGTDRELRHEIDRLKRNDYGQPKKGVFHNSLDTPQVAQEISKLSSTLNAREADRKTSNAQSKAVWWGDFYKSVDDPDISAAELMLHIDNAVEQGLMSGEQIGKARKLALGGAHETASQNENYGRLRGMAASDDPAERKKFADTRLGDESGDLSTEQAKALDKLQHDMKTDRAGYRTQEDMRKSALSVLGMGKSASSMTDEQNGLIDQFDRAIDASIAGLEKKEQRQATPMEIQAITDDVARTVLRDGRQTGGGWFGIGSKSLLERGVPQSFIDDQYTAAALDGVPVPTAEEMLKDWEQSGGGRK